MENAGTALFGLVIGWVTYRTLRRSGNTVGLSDIAAVIAALGGGVITGLFPESGQFAMYAIGLAVGFFAYFLVALALEGKESVTSWMGTPTQSSERKTVGRP